MYVCMYAYIYSYIIAMYLTIVIVIQHFHIAIATGIMKCPNHQSLCNQYNHCNMAFVILIFKFVAIAS